MKKITIFAVSILLFTACKKSQNNNTTQHTSYSDAINKGLGVSFNTFYAYSISSSHSSGSSGIIMFGADTSATEVVYNSTTPNHPYDTMTYKLIYQAVDSPHAYQVQFYLMPTPDSKQIIIDSLLGNYTALNSIGLFGRDLGVFDIIEHAKNDGANLICKNNYSNDIRFHGWVSYPIYILK
jgi:hypothetical protein